MKLTAPYDKAGPIPPVGALTAEALIRAPAALEPEPPNTCFTILLVSLSSFLKKFTIIIVGKYYRNKIYRPNFCRNLENLDNFFWKME